MFLNSKKNIYMYKSMTGWKGEIRSYVSRTLANMIIHLKDNP